MDRFLAYALIPLFVGLLTPAITFLIYKGLRKAGVAEYSPEYVNSLRSKSFPKKYDFYYYLLTGAYLLLFVILIVICNLAIFGFLNNFINQLRASDSIFFDNYGLMIILAINLIGFTLLSVIITQIIYSFFLKGNFGDYLILKSTKVNEGFKAPSLIRKLIIIMLIYYLLASPFIYFSLKAYNVIYFDKLIFNPYFSISDKTYQYSDIENVRYNIYQGKDYASPYMLFKMKDGRNIEIFYKNMNNPETGKNILNILKLHQIPLENFPNNL